MARRILARAAAFGVHNVIRGGGRRWLLVGGGAAVENCTDQTEHEQKRRGLVIIPVFVSYHAQFVNT